MKLYNNLWQIEKMRQIIVIKNQEKCFHYKLMSEDNLAEIN